MHANQLSRIFAFARDYCELGQSERRAVDLIELLITVHGELAPEMLLKAVEEGDTSHTTISGIDIFFAVHFQELDVGRTIDQYVLLRDARKNPT
jgi:hypothetical protein